MLLDLCSRTDCSDPNGVGGAIFLLDSHTIPAPLDFVMYRPKPYIRRPPDLCATAAHVAPFPNETAARLAGRDARDHRPFERVKLHATSSHHGNHIGDAGGLSSWTGLISSTSETHETLSQIMSAHRMMCQSRLSK